MTAPLLDELLTFPDLPMLPPAAVRLLDLMDDPLIDPSEIGGLLGREPELSRNLLLAVNSGHFKLDKPCTSVDRAMLHLGLSTVRTLVLGFSLVDLSKSLGRGFNLQDFWRRCFYSAAAARRIAVVTRSCNPEESFLSALMQDIGMMAMQSVLGPRYANIVKRTQGNHRLLPHWERAQLGFTHAEAGAHLAERWGLPAQLVEPIRHHHTKITDPNLYSPTVNTVALACQIATLGTTPDPQASFITVGTMSKKLFSLSVQDTRALLKAAAQDTRGLSGLLDMKGDGGSVIAEALVRQQSEMHQEAASLLPADLADEPSAREAAARRVLRQHFERDVARDFDRARGGNMSLGLILGEVDDYEALKNKLGSEEVDRILKAVGERIRHCTEDTGQLCRLEDGQFAVIVPRASRVDAARLAERLRLDVNEQALGPPGTTVTVSLGVAALEPAVADYLVRWELLVQLSRNATLAAARAGRNCVRVFKPKRTREAA